MSDQLAWCFAGLYVCLGCSLLLVVKQLARIGDHLAAIEKQLERIADNESK